MNELLNAVTWVGGNEDAGGMQKLPISIRRLLNRLSNQPHLPVQQLMVRKEPSSSGSGAGATGRLYLTIFGGDPGRNQAYLDFITAYEQIDPCGSYSIAGIRVVPVGLRPVVHAPSAAR